MFKAIGYDVSYRRGAFKAEGLIRGSYYNPTFGQLTDAFATASRDVFHEGGGKWLVIDSSLGFRGEQQPAIEMFIVVPVGPKQYEDFLEAVNTFEKTMKARLGGPLDTSLRTIEPNQLEPSST